MNNLSPAGLDLPVYVICMEREEERRKQISRHFYELGITFSFSDAVDGHQLTKKQSELYSDQASKEHLGRSMALGEIGCYLSHTNIWQSVVNNNIPYALIIESDGVLSDEVLTVVDSVIQKSDDWELVMLFYRECFPSFWNRNQLTKNTKLVRFSNKSSCTTAYLINQSGAQKLLKYAFPIKMPVDDYMTGGYINKSLNTYAVYPRLVNLTEDALESSSIREDLFPLMKEQGVKRRLPEETNLLKEFEKKIRRNIKKLLPPPWL